MSVSSLWAITLFKNWEIFLLLCCESSLWQSWWPSTGLAPLYCCLDLGKPKLVTVFEMQFPECMMEAVISPLTCVTVLLPSMRLAFFMWGYAADTCSAHPLGPPLFVGLLFSHCGTKSIYSCTAIQPWIVICCFRALVYKSWTSGSALLEPSDRAVWACISTVCYCSQTAKFNSSGQRWDFSSSSWAHCFVSGRCKTDILSAGYAYNCITSV